MDNKNKIFSRPKPGKVDDPGNDRINFLVLHNDDIHTFEYVITCLVDICGHDAVQAEQCAWLVHYKGSCDILKGGYRQLLPYLKKMASKELKVTID